jgi:hypothetical protein
MKKALLVTLALLGASHAQAQDASAVRANTVQTNTVQALQALQTVQELDIQLEPVERDEARRWMEDVRSYAAWYDRYRNRISRNIFGFIGERRQMPPVPGWLPAKCNLLANFDPPPSGPLSEACALLAFYRSNFTIAPGARQALLAQKQNEQDPHSSFWKHVHLDAGWGSLDYRTHTYGLVGVHVTLPEIAKRLQIYLPPGFLLLSIPDGHGGRTLQPAATVGASIRMFAFEFPKNSPGTAYFNLAKAFVINQSSSPTGTNAAVDLVGLSFAWGQ